jgi:heme/copper-type cytochrome/quinol oxidase subunit 2
MTNSVLQGTILRYVNYLLVISLPRNKNTKEKVAKANKNMGIEIFIIVIFIYILSC